MGTGLHRQPKGKKLKAKTSEGKLKPPGNPTKPPPPKRSRVLGPTSIGTAWDSKNYSCSYDAVVTPIYDNWQEHGPRSSENFEQMGKYMIRLARDFQSVQVKTSKLEDARDQVQKILHNDYPDEFLNGAELTDIDDLCSRMFGKNTWRTETIKCLDCPYSEMDYDAFESKITSSAQLRMVRWPSRTRDRRAS